VRATAKPLLEEYGNALTRQAPARGEGREFGECRSRIWKPKTAPCDCLKIPALPADRVRGAAEGKLPEVAGTENTGPFPARARRASRLERVRFAISCEF
jgi:hypothetical protein